MMNQRTLKLLFLLGHSVNPDGWVSQENLLSMLGGEFGEEASFLNIRGLIEVRIEEVRRGRVDNFVRLTERGKEEAEKIRLRMR